MPKLKLILQKHSLHTFAPDVDISEEEAARVTNDCDFIVKLLQRGWTIPVGDNEQMNFNQMNNSL